MQTQAGPVPARAGLQPQFWKLWQKGVRHTLVLLFGHTSWLAGSSFPTLGTAVEELSPDHKANGELDAVFRYFFSYLKTLWPTVGVGHRDREYVKQSGLSPALAAPPSAAAPSVCLAGATDLLAMSS